MDGSEKNDSLLPCHLCGRKFLSERLERHTSICSKTKETQKRRKIFDSSKQRETEELSVIKVTATTVPLNKKQIAHPVPSSSSSSSNPTKKTNWRQQHEEFIKTIRMARGEKVEDDHDNGDGDINGQSKVPIGYVKCDCCGRNFSQKAADRHIEWCKEQNKRIPRSASNIEAQERMKARIKYKPSVKGSQDANHSPASNHAPASKQTPASDKKEGNLNLQSKAGKVKAMSNGQVKGQNRIANLSKPKKYANHDNEMMKDKINDKKNVMKFKEKFPNYPISQNSKYIENSQLKEIMKKSDFIAGPKTVPGVRTGGIGSKYDTYIRMDDPDEETLASLKAKIEEMYINGTSKYKPNNELNGVKRNESVQNGNGNREISTSSSEGSNGQSRDGSSDGKRTGGLPKFCHQCGTKYPISIAKYCYECGSRRLGTVGPFLVDNYSSN